MNKLRLLHYAAIVVGTALFLLQQAGTDARLDSPMLQNAAYPILRRVSATFADWKFHMRGPVPPTGQATKVAIVEIDSASLADLGRWPWHRNLMAYLIDRTFKAGARVVGLDMLFSEPEQKIPEDLVEQLKQRHLESLLETYDTDSILAKTIRKYRDRLVLSWAADVECRPLYARADECPLADPALIAALPASLPRFALPADAQFADARHSPLPSVAIALPNLDRFNEVAQYQGFANSFPDPDGATRRAGLLMLMGTRAYPSMPLQVASLMRQQTLEASFEGPRLRELRWMPSRQPVPVNAAATGDIGFYGPGRTIPTVTAGDVLHDSEQRTVASETTLAPLKDAAVLIGVSALAQGDIRATPFDSHVPGVEVQATILANLLQGELMDRRGGFWCGLLLLTLAALALEWWGEKWEARPALALFGIAMCALILVDNALFVRGVLWDTSMIYLQWMGLAVVMLGTKYFREEQKKKFLRTAFSKYVSPAVVDTLVKDPAQLSLGGTKRSLTVLFSDIRGFTSISETMDPAHLTELLNRYFSLMTGLVFKQRGTVDKFVGDALMAFWGAPLDDSKQAAHACEAARAMQRTLAESRADFEKHFGHSLRIGIGIHSGTASVGNMGSENSFGYTAIGDDVNLASRLETATKNYGVGILVSRATLDAITAGGDPLPPHRALDWLIVKGRSQAVEILEVLDQPLLAEALAQFAQGRAHYEARRWAEAVQAFEAADRALGGDAPCKMYLERCRELQAEPPATDWDGSWNFEAH